MFATIRLAQRQALDAAVRAPDVGDYWEHRGSGDLRASFVIAAYYSQNSAARFVSPIFSKFGQRINRLGIKIIDGNQADAMNIFAITTAVRIFAIAVVMLLGLWLMLRG